MNTNTYIKITHIFFIILMVFCIISCEDVIDVDVQTAPTRLTIEASLDWEKGTSGNNQIIKLSTSTAYFDTTSNTAVTGASVNVTNTTSGAVFNFTDQNDGTYTTVDFVPVFYDSYTLEVIYNGEKYEATETLFPVVDFINITQSREDGFDEEALEANITFIDPEEEGNYYFIKVEEEGERFSSVAAFEDEFVNGNEIGLLVEKYDEEEDEDEEFVVGDTIEIYLFGISEAYYNYVNILSGQFFGAGIFDPTPVDVKGNCINVDNKDNYANGYFRVTEVIRENYTFE
ncbi:DUF4249 family protein [Aquimarina pacifica]|uniref:DUF4249 family protein n=1 Tax=Aquimarina pacifica TaxID=1296415 RepID=UPI00054D0342|nr:DUF4249 family protein [Aquimarina pacifica]